MAIPFTLLLYIARSFLFRVFIVTGVLGLLCFFINFAEIARRLTARGVTDYDTIVKMAFYQTPGILEAAFPFIFLVASISCFFSFSKRHELDAVRSSGISAWVFLSPVMVIALLSGFFIMAIYNPVSSGFNTSYDELYARYIRSRSVFSISATGIWLKQGDEKKHSIVHAANTDKEGKNFRNITIFLYEDKDAFVGRLDAKQATLNEGAWMLKSVWVTRSDGNSYFADTYRQATQLTPGHVYESVAPPQSISFWNLGNFITLAQRAQLAVPSYQFHWFSLALMPLFLVAMTLLGASASFFFSTRQGREFWLVTSCLFFGVVIYALLFFGRKISAAPETPIVLAVAAPITVAFVVGLLLFLQKEEG